MRLTLIGYGKMGKAIEAIAIERGHTILLKIGSQNAAELKTDLFKESDAAIEFTTPETAFNNIQHSLNSGVPVVSGSTGWLHQYEKAKDICVQTGGSMLVASNFSIGVNIFFAVNQQLAQLMAAHQSYDVSVHEIHHTQKKDSPSGTAITLAEQIIAALPAKTKWVDTTPASSNELLITSERIDPAPGTHTVSWQSEIDDISITHTAHNRKGFALGAVLAAEYIAQRKGIFSMKDVLGL
jgi:4-hydroxy-tetrahydrodipicolinate reductase